jgi:hypothetical protein
MKRTLLIGLLWLAGSLSSVAEEPGKGSVSITAIEPASLVTGGVRTFKIRGFKLKEATELRFPEAPGVTAVIKEKKDATQPKGLENKVAGDCQLLAEITLSAELPASVLKFVVAVPSGDVHGSVHLVDPERVLEETEPNNGFRETCKLPPGKFVRGEFQGEKDVDVYEWQATAGRKLKIRAIGGGSLLMDPMIQCYDANGQFLAASDDAEDRDPSLEFTPRHAGPIFICLTDAHDMGGEWHSYLLTVYPVE